MSFLRPPLTLPARGLTSHLLTIVLALASSTLCAAQPEVARALLIHPSDLMLPGAALQDRITREAIAAAVGQPIDFYSEAFDSFRVPGQQAKFIDFLKNKYGTRTPHLIVAHGPMHDLIKQHAAELWPGVPVMLVDVGAHRIAEGVLPPGVPFTSSQMDVAGTLELALQLHPQTTRVVVVAGEATYDRDALSRALMELRNFAPRVEIEALRGLSAEQLIAAVARLTPGTVVIQLTVHIDGAGNAHVGQTLVEELSRVSAVPMYSFYDTYMGHGIVGGHLMNREGQRAAIGEIARRLLLGESTSALPMPTVAASICSVDWRQVERWGIDERLIPDDCRVMFREPAFWQRYRVHLTVAVAALLLQGAWLGAWWAQRKRRRRAELANAIRTSELTHAARLGAVGGLMASITHEISQPLMSILTNAAAGERMIASGRADMEEIRSILADIRSDEARAGAVISHLREFMKKREVSMEPVQMNDLVGKALKIIDSAARKHEVKVIAALDDNTAMVLGDGVHLQQVVLNLALNAIEAMAVQPVAHRVLTVRTTWSGKLGVEVAVSDTGCGIPPDRASRLFEPFYTTKADGMGIGLSIAQMIIEAHGGRIWAEPNNPGTTMRFTVPPPRKRQTGVNPTAAVRA